jgi:O-antigen ligase
MPKYIAEEFSSHKKTGIFSVKFLVDIFPLVFIAAVLFPVLSGADSYLYQEGILRIPYPTFFLLLSIFAPVLLRNLARDHCQEFQKVYQNTARITISFGVIVLISLIWAMHPEANWSEGGRYIFFRSYHFVLLIFSIGLAYSQVIRKYYRPIILTILIGTSISIWTDVVYPGTFSYQTTRASGFIGNANEGALTVLYLMIPSINWKKNDLLNLFVLSITGLSIFTTLSVGTVALFLMIVVFYMAMTMKNNATILKRMAYILTFLALILFIVIPMGMDAIENSNMFSHSDSQNRVNEMLNMGQGDLTFVEEHDRIRLVKVYLALILDAPIVGYGTGFTAPGDNESHNIFLRMWVQNGLLGLLAYLSLMYYSFYHFMILKDTRGMVFIFVICGAGFFDHNILNSKTFVGLLGILGTLAYLEYPKTSQRVLQKRKWSW